MQVYLRLHIHRKHVLKLTLILPCFLFYINLKDRWLHKRVQAANLVANSGNTASGFGVILLTRASPLYMHHWKKAFFIDYIFTHVSPYTLCTLYHHYIYTSYWNITQLWQETMTRSYVYTILTIHLLKGDQFQSTCHGSKLCLFSLSWNCYHPISTPRSMRFPLFYASIKILMASFDRTAYIATENTNIPFKIYMNFQILKTGNF